jgi:uncharacterized RDD family membrane protein YckC
MSSPAADARYDPLRSRPVVYRSSDYVGAFRRLLIYTVDASVLLIIAVPLGSWFPLLAMAFAWCYLAVLKPSRIRSPGYWVAGAKIVTLDGRSPSPFRMTLRLMWIGMWTIGWPIGFFADWLWTSMDDDRQMLRDLCTETRLVRNRATPIGPGRISYVLCTGIGLTVLYARVRANDHDIQPLEVSSFAEVPAMLPEMVTEKTAAIRTHDGSIIQCPKCGIRIIPKSSGHCPSCQTQLFS